MSVLNSNPFLIASGSPTDPTFPLQRSLRFRSSASAYLNRTPASAGSRTTWTWSGWVKRGSSATNKLFATNLANNDAGYTTIYFYQDALRVTGFTTNWRQTTQLFRDYSAWYHIVVVWDTTNATASERVRIYVNGVQVTAFSVTNNPAQNATSGINAASATYIGAEVYGGPIEFFDGYLTEINFVDGQALTPSSFGGYNAGTNVWEVRKYTGTYGTNGFYLPFTNPASIGADGSGNSNNWTANNIQTSNSALVTYDSMLDVPTNTGPTNANFCIANPLDVATGLTISDGNLKLAASTSVSKFVRSSIALPTTGAFYAEIIFANAATSSIGQTIGICTASRSLTAVNNATGAYLFYASAAGALVSNGTTTASSLATITANELFQVAVDVTNSKMWIGRNNVWYNSTGGTTGDPSTGANPTFTGSFVDYYIYAGFDTASAVSANLNFGQRPFAGTVPSGFKSLNTYNLPEPTIPRGDKYFKQYLYTGNGGGQQIGEIQKPASLFNLDRSLRFRKSNSAYLSRTQTTTTNSVKCTFSGWVKRGELGTLQVVFGGYTGTDADTQLYFDTTNQLKFTSRITNVNGAAFEWVGESAAVFRDPQLWLHIVVKVDTSVLQATNNAYYTVYVNGIAQTFTTVSGASLVSAATVQNRNTCWNVSGYTGTVARQRTNYFDGYLSDLYFIDGQALDATSFGAYDGNNYWTPIAYTGTYGTNGFHLEFEDYSAATATTIGKDTSGNGNNFTPTGINLTTPANTNVAWDSMTDVPTLTDENTSNFCTLTPLTTTISGTTWSNGNLTISFTATSTKYQYPCTNTLTNGKWYFEGNLASFSVGNAGNNFMMIGFKTPSSTSASPTMIEFGWGSNGTSMSLRARYIVAGTVVTNTQFNTTTPISTDVFAVAYDASAGTMDCYKNGTLMGTLSNISLGEVVPVVCRDGSTNGATWNLNFGQRPFRDTPPSGFKAINSANIAEVTGDVETPDFVWIKSRSAATGHALFSKVTGEGKYLSSNATTAETTDVNSLIQFNKNGFLLGNSAIVNTLNNTYVANAWKAGNTTVTNTDGTITSQVRANQIAGFSEITYTGTGANATVGHGLGVAPKMVIAKSRNNSGTSYQWVMYHASVGAGSIMVLNATNAAIVDATSWNNLAPTATVVNLGTNTHANGSASQTVAYCFSEIAGYSKFGSYTGTGNSNGAFVYTGFRPRWIMTKQTGAISNWSIHDTSRAPYNLTINELYSDTADAEYTGTNDSFDLLSNGFKPRSAGTPTNASGGTYIYAAFAENPFKYALAR